MRKKDTIFAIVCGLAVAWIAADFFKGPEGYPGWFFFFIVPALSVIGLWLVDLIGKKILFVKQAGRFALAGAFADVIDIKVFQLLFLLAPFSLVFKGISFLIATVVKYLANKHWAFPARIGYAEGVAGGRKNDIIKELIQFFVVTLGGLILNVGSFYYFTKIMGPQFSMPVKAWTELSIIFSALVVAIWNFSGYKFIVFKK